MPKVLVTPEALRDQPGPFVEELQAAGFEVCYPRHPTFARGLLSEQETIEELRVADATIASGERYSQRVLDAVSQLRVIARCGVGYDQVDVPAATRHQIAVTITPTANHAAVAELTLALLLSVAKSIVANHQRLADGQWPRQLVRPVRGTTLGIVGLGRIGRSLATRARALEMRVLACETRPDPQFVAAQGIELVPLERLLAESDFVSLHCPLNDQTRGLMNRETFGLMRPGSVLLNTARGGLVVEADLIEALQSGHLGGAGLDVFAQEPPDPANPLLHMPQVVASPHIAGCDWQSMAAMALEAARCIIRLARGEWPSESVVNGELAEHWQWQRPV